MPESISKQIQHKLTIGKLKVRESNKKCEVCGWRRTHSALSNKCGACH